MAIRRKDYDRPDAPPSPAPVYITDEAKKPATIDADGTLYVAMLPGKQGRKMCVTGIMFDAPAGEETDGDLTFPETREIQGSGMEVANHQPGDYAELHICAPDGTSVGQFGEMVYIPPSGKIDQIVSEGTVGFPPGFRLRLRFVAAEAGGVRTVYAWHRLRK
jgi:hypothetical protein